MDRSERWGLAKFGRMRRQYSPSSDRLPTEGIDILSCRNVARSEEDREMFDAGHYKPEGIYKSAQFDLTNINCQCRGCNRYHHGRYGDYAEALIKKYGIEEFNALIERSRKTKSWTEKELLTLIVAINNPTNYTRIHNNLLNQL